MRRKQAGLVLGCSLCVAAVSTASAQTSPGAVGDTLKKPPQLQTPKPPPKVETAPKPAAPAPAGKTFVLKGFDFQGNQIFTDTELAAALAPYLGKSLTLADVYDAADQVTGLYVARGFTLASTNVPPQRIDTGILRLDVIEGRIGRVKVEGAKQYREESIRAYLEGVGEGQVYQGTALTQGLSVLNELPGLTTRATIQPGDAFGTSDVIVKAKEDIVEASAGVDNYGRKDVGEFRFTGTVTVNNPLRVEDQLQLLGLISEHGLLKYGYGAYSLPLNGEGTRLQFDYGYADFEVRHVDGLDGKNKSGGVQVSHPFLRTRSQRLSAHLGVQGTEADADISGLPVGTRTNMALVTAGMTFLQAWPNASITQLTVDMSSNFDKLTDHEIFEATLGAGSGADTVTNPKSIKDQRFRGEIDMLHLVPLWSRWQMMLRVDGAWSPDPLADTSKFSLGGPGSVRGYPSSEVRGDRGVLGQLTLRHPIDIGKVSLFGSLFVDGGKVKLLEVDGVAEADSESISSAGLGLEASYSGWTAKLEGAFPLDDREVSDNREDFRAFGSLVARF